MNKLTTLIVVALVIALVVGCVPPENEYAFVSSKYKVIEVASNYNWKCMVLETSGKYTDFDCVKY